MMCSVRKEDGFVKAVSCSAPDVINTPSPKFLVFQFIRG